MEQKGEATVSCRQHTSESSAREPTLYCDYCEIRLWLLTA